MVINNEVEISFRKFGPGYDYSCKPDINKLLACKKELDRLIVELNKVKGGKTTNFG